MMDVIMIGILAVSFGLMKLLADFCDRQISDKDKR